MDTHNPFTEINQGIDRLAIAAYKSGYWSGVFHSSIVVCIIACGILLASCTSIGTEPPPADWPTLKVTRYDVPHAKMRDICVKHVNAISSPEACFEIDFVSSTCVIWYSADFPPTAAVVNEMQQSCAGFDQTNSTNLADAWRSYKGAK